MENKYDAYYYACDKFPETLLTLNEDELNDLEFCENEDEVIEYLMTFNERT